MYAYIAFDHGLLGFYTDYMLQGSAAAGLPHWVKTQYSRSRLIGTRFVGIFG